MTRETSQKRRLAADGGADEPEAATHLRECARHAALAAIAIEDGDELPEDLVEDIDEVAGKADRVKNRLLRIVEKELATDGGRAASHGREYARQQARDHRAMERRNYLLDGRTSTGRRL